MNNENESVLIDDEEFLTTNSSDESSDSDLFDILMGRCPPSSTITIE